MKLTAQLAEFLGMHAGDGHLRIGKRYEFEMSGDVEEKEYYDKHVLPLINKLFSLQLHARHMHSKGTYGLSTSERKIVHTLVEAGFPKGAKSTTFSVPQEVLQHQNQEIKRGFLRGVIDTDGCVRFDKNTEAIDKFKNTFHWYPRIIHSTVSHTFHQGLKQLLQQEGYIFSSYNRQPKIPTENRKHFIQISGILQCKKWFKDIGLNNPVKLTKYQIWALHGFCPTKTTLQERRKILKGEVNPYTYYDGPVV